MNDIVSLQKRVIEAEERLVRALRRKYPIGTTVRFYIMHGQVTPSRGQVIGHTGGRYAYVRVSIDSRTRPCRDIPEKDIL